MTIGINPISKPVKIIFFVTIKFSRIVELSTVFVGLLIATMFEIVNVINSNDVFILI